MWLCPNCGRSFKNANQNHSCAEKPETIEAYIAAQPDSAQGLLSQIQGALRAALPDAQEKIAWGIPTFREKHNLIQFAAQKQHIGLYPGPEAVVYFAEELKPYKTSKGTIHLPYDQPLPLELIAKIAVWNLKTGNHP